MNNLYQKINEKYIDIVGDIHGEFDALIMLLKNMGYDEDGHHPENRKLLFNGDFCDRGPDSVKTILKIKKLCENKTAFALLGNHEMNLLMNQSKTGSGWYFEDIRQLEHDKDFEPYYKATPKEKEEIFQFLDSLPFIIESPDYFFVHAAYHAESFEFIKNLSIQNGHLISYSKNKFTKLLLNKFNQHKEINLKPSFLLNEIESILQTELKDSGILFEYEKVATAYEKDLINRRIKPPFFDIIATYNAFHQINNPFRIVCSGSEKKSKDTFYASGKWRFVERDKWWEHTHTTKPVIIGHYWRKRNSYKTHTEDVFHNIDYNQWFGVNQNIFCIDYSVGKRFVDRLLNRDFSSSLAALQLPQEQLCFEHGEKVLTIRKNTKKNHIKKSIHKIKCNY